MNISLCRTVVAGLLLSLLLAGTSAANEEFTVTDPAIQFMPVIGGCFERGDTFGSGQPDEYPVRDICVGSFFMATREVTVRDFQQFVSRTGYVPEADSRGFCYQRTADGGLAGTKGLTWSSPGFVQSPAHPVVCVSPADARAFADWLTAAEGRKFRLPTEAEWEFAARAGGRQLEYATSTGDISPELANFKGTALRDIWPQTAPAGSFPANPVGLHDMSGNVYEWCEDMYDSDAYASAEERDPLRRGEGPRVKRGGSWDVDATALRAANRGSNPFAANDIGFRLVSAP